MRTRRSKKIVVAAGIIIVVIAGTVLFLKRDDIALRLQRAALPEAVEYDEATLNQPPSLTTGTTTPALSPTPASVRPTEAEVRTSTLPAAINLKVPFTPQAPHAIWTPPYKEFCEEASVLMAASYLQNKTIPSAAVADEKMLAIKAFEEKRFGYYEDTTAAETAVILREFYKIEAVKLMENPSVADFKTALAAGKLVIVPAAGRLLGNPYYTPPGPLYHMLVIKGYTADGKFITNDPGTRRGADFLYSPETILNALHDWRADGNIEQGKKVVIVVG